MLTLRMGMVANIPSFTRNESFIANASSLIHVTCTNHHGDCVLWQLCIIFVLVIRCVPRRKREERAEVALLATCIPGVHETRNTWQLGTL